MKSEYILTTRGWRIKSHGNGLAYTIRNHGAKCEVYVQGETASEFRDAWERAEETAPHAPVDRLIARIWCDLGLGLIAECV